jgi:uncharacterized protein YdbL (DUF1318 family)
MTEVAAESRPVRWGLAAKLFAILLLLGAVADMITGVLGYIRAREALERAIFAQLTAARETKAHQVESYFRTVRNEVRLLAASKMVVDATRGFREAVDELDGREVPAAVKQSVHQWYDTQYMPTVRKLLGKDVGADEFMPMTAAPYVLQDLYIVRNPHPEGRRDLLDDPGDGSTYSKIHAIFHPADADRGRHRGVRRLHDRRPAHRPADLHGRQGPGFRHVAARRSLSTVQTRRGGRTLRRGARSVAHVPRGLCAVPAVGRRSRGLHGGAGDRPGGRDRRAGRGTGDRRDRRDHHGWPALAQ